MEQDWHVYPEQAAAGLWTTPTDLARWGLTLLAAYDGATGGNVIREVLTTLAAAYGWPAFKPMEKSPTKWPESRLAEVAGRYRLPDDPDTVVVTLEGGRLYLAHPAFGKVELLAQSDSSLFLRDDGTDVTVVREDGRVVGLSARGQQARRIGR